LLLPTIGFLGCAGDWGEKREVGKDLKASCHREGLDKAALKGILWDSAAMNSRGSEIPTGPMK
jgi:hypothetical protein